MEIRQLLETDTKDFQELIVDMYSNIDNLEWFSPMPFDDENVLGMLTNPRFFIVGLFYNAKLVAVSSLDYKCGKLIGTLPFPTDFDTTKMVEIGFTMVHSSFKGNKAMQLLLDYLLIKLKLDGMPYVFAKVHQDNIASKKSFLNKGFNPYLTFDKTVDKQSFKELAETSFFSKSAKPLAYQTLAKHENSAQIIVPYLLLTKKL